MFKSIYRVIPKSYRRKTLFVALTIFLRALLNFVGIAMLIPVLMIIVGGDIESNHYMGVMYEWLGLSSEVFVAIVCGAVVVVLVAKNVLNQILYRAERSYIFSLYKYLSRRLYISYYQRGLGFIKRSNSAHLTRDVNAVTLMFTTGVLKPIAQIAGEVMLLVIFLLSLLLYSPYLALIAIAIFTPIVLLFYSTVRRTLREVGNRENEVQRIKNRIVAETYRGYADVKIGGAMPQMLQRFDSMMTEIVELRNRHASISMLPQAFIEIGLVIGLVAMAMWGNSGDADVQLMFGIFVVAAVRLLPVIRNIMSAWSTIRFNRYTIDTIKDINYDDAGALNSTSERLDMRRNIELCDVSFKFDDANEELISNFSLRISCGERIGIRGVSGVGKTTLFNIILGLYRPTRGKILIDDVELTESNIEKWQNSIGYVSQSVFISDQTLAENIAFGIDSENIDYDRVNEVVELADLKPFVDSLPNGIHSRIGEQGSRMSGGQRQRIGIARALYKRCDVMLFDEATSSLDSITESNINSAISKLSSEHKELTIIVIAHRESSLEYCDRIITLE
jgi:ABC-type multidrug transport system fused ATPase/permease subunit